MDCASQYDSGAIAILHDIENGSYSMLFYALKKARKGRPTKIVVVSDWVNCLGKGKWNNLFNQVKLSFMQVERKFSGKNSLDYALLESALILQRDGMRRFIIVTSDGDFAGVIERLRRDYKAHVIGIGNICSSEKLRTACDKFYWYPSHIANKVSQDYVIPPGEPNEDIRQCLIDAYSKAKKGRVWISIDVLSGALQKYFPDLVFPTDHPRKLRNTIKIYQESFEWKRDGYRLLIKRKK